MSQWVVSYYVCKETFSIRACVKHVELDSVMCVIRVPRAIPDKIDYTVDWSQGETVPILQVMPDIKSAHELLKRFLST